MILVPHVSWYQGYVILQYIFFSIKKMERDQSSKIENTLNVVYYFLCLCSVEPCNVTYKYFSSSTSGQSATRKCYSKCVQGEVVGCGGST